MTPPRSVAPLRAALCCLVIFFSNASVVFAQIDVKEPSTGKAFPIKVRFTDQGAEHTLAITGLAVRRWFFFDIYSMAHYMENASRGPLPAVLRTVLANNSTKQVTMAFARDIGAKRVQNALLDSLRNNATPLELEEIRPHMGEFARSIYKDVEEDDRFIIRWLPGGRTISVFQGRVVTTITNVTFARVLWSIWFGEVSVVDRAQLVKFLTQGS